MPVLHSALTSQGRSERTQVVPITDAVLQRHVTDLLHNAHRIWNQEIQGYKKNEQHIFGEHGILRFDGVTHIGNGNRERQEDRISRLRVPLLSSESNSYEDFFIVADGMGGQGNGDKAARATITVINNIYPLLRQAGKSREEALQAAIGLAGDVIAKANAKNEQYPDDTPEDLKKKADAVVAMVVIGEDGQYTFASSGDSIGFMDSPFSLITEPDNLAYLFKRNPPEQLDPLPALEATRSHPQRSNVFGGVRGQVKDPSEEATTNNRHLRFATGTITEDQSILVSSDGLWEMINILPNEAGISIQEILTNPVEQAHRINRAIVEQSAQLSTISIPTNGTVTPAFINSVLLTAARLGGGVDNISSFLIQRVSKIPDENPVRRPSKEIDIDPEISAFGETMHQIARTLFENAPAGDVENLAFELLQQIGVREFLINIDGVDAVGYQPGPDTNSLSEHFYRTGNRLRELYETDLNDLHTVEEVSIFINDIERNARRMGDLIMRARLMASSILDNHGLGVSSIAINRLPDLFPSAIFPDLLEQERTTPNLVERFIHDTLQNLMQEAVNQGGEQFPKVVSLLAKLLPVPQNPTEQQLQSLIVADDIPATQEKLQQLFEQLGLAFVYQSQTRNIPDISLIPESTLPVPQLFVDRLNRILEVYTGRYIILDGFENLSSSSEDVHSDYRTPWTTIFEGSNKTEIAEAFHLLNGGNLLKKNKQMAVDGYFERLELYIDRLDSESPAYRELHAIIEAYKLAIEQIYTSYNLQQTTEREQTMTDDKRADYQRAGMATTQIYESFDALPVEGKIEYVETSLSYAMLFTEAIAKLSKVTVPTREINIF